MGRLRYYPGAARILDAEKVVDNACCKAGVISFLGEAGYDCGTPGHFMTEMKSATGCYGSTWQNQDTMRLHQGIPQFRWPYSSVSPRQAI